MALSDNAPLGLEAAQKVVDAWIRQHGVRYFNELTNLAILMEEVGELARLFARQFGEQSFKQGEPEKEIADELADVLWVVLCLANQTGVHLEEAFRKNLEKKTHRDALRHKQNPKLAQGENKELSLSQNSENAQANSQS